jgi:CPA2 family monovalent cation:H+ antiporter-2
MIIAETRYKHQVEADLIPFRDLLLGIFFITVGMQIDFSIIAAHYGTIIGLLVLFTLVKVSIIFLLLVRSTGKRVALKTALALFQLGEFGLVVFELAGKENLIDPTISQVLIVTITISMVLTPFVLRNISSLANLVLRDDEDVSCEKFKDKTLKDHIIVLGYGRLGRKICEKLDHRAVKYIAIENNIHNVKAAQKEGKSVIFGNAAKKTILESVNIQDSAVVIVALDNSEKLHLICDVLTQVVSKSKVIIKVDRFKEKDALTEEFPDYEILVGTEQMARGMVDSVLKCKV